MTVTLSIKNVPDELAQRLKEPFGNTEERTRIREWRKKLLAEHPQLHEAELPAKGAEGKLNGRQYAQMVEKAKEHIFAGDIFEVCVCNRFLAPYSGTSERLYQCLRSVNEAPFASYLRSPEVEVISSSPERFMRLDRQGWAETRPIKGTRPRGATPEQDEALRESLRTEEKDLAENIMIVDLARNDLGRVCEFGTVRAPELRIVETYPFNHQLVSTVRGKLLPGRSPVDLIRASYPGGSMTGAPKVEAMKIIARLEPVNRGIFSGAIGYFGYDGALDLNIVIRTLVRVGDMISFHVGGAIVADSDPDAEYQETLDKAYGLVSAIGLARAS